MRESEEAKKVEKAASAAEKFRSEIDVLKQRAREVPRTLTDDEIRACEAVKLQMKGKLPESGKISVAEVEKIDEAVRAANASGKAESAAEMAKKTGIFNDTNEVSKTTIRISNGSEYFHKQDVDGLNELIKHLTYDVDVLDFEPNKAMISKIKEMISNKQALTGAYKDFYEHELTESMLMKQGFGYNDAHNMALTIHEVRPQALYSPEIVRKYYEWFNKGDYEYWGIK